MSLIGVYPDVYLMTKDQLIDYCTFIEAQAVTKEFDQEKRIEYLENTLEKCMEKLRND